MNLFYENETETKLNEFTPKLHMGNLLNPAANLLVLYVLNVRTTKIPLSAQPEPRCEIISRFQASHRAKLELCVLSESVVNVSWETLCL